MSFFKVQSIIVMFITSIICDAVIIEFATVDYLIAPIEA